MIGNRGNKDWMKIHFDSSQKVNDSVWDHIVIEALETGMTTDEYIEFIEFIKKLSANKSTLEMPITYYFQMFNSGASHHLDQSQI